MQAHQAASRMFWSIYTDRYLEMIKDRVDDASARWTLRDSFRALLGLFAPFAPFLTEHMYQRFYGEHEGVVSLHLTSWPAADPRWRSDRSAVDQLAVILDATRVLRSGLRLGNSARLSQLVVQAHDEAARALLDQIAEPLRVPASIPAAWTASPSASRSRRAPGRPGRRGPSRCRPLAAWPGPVATSRCRR